MSIQKVVGVISGDGIGPEVTEQAVRVIKQVCQGERKLVFREFDLGAERYLRTGEIITENDFRALEACDAILLGAIGDPRVPSGVLERGLLLQLRFRFDHYVNLRPAKYYPGVPTPLANPGDIDFVVVREGTEGLYCGNGGSVRTGTDKEIATEVSVNTAYGVERLVRYGFDLAQQRNKKLTYVHKHNVLVYAGGLWRRIVGEISEEYPEVEVDYLHVDAATIFMVTNPSRFDVIVTDNLFGDILTDEAGAITGGIGLAASGNINPDGNYPSMFEPVHGSAPDIAGQNIADPLAAIVSATLLLDNLGYGQEADKIREAVERDMAWRRDNPQVSRSTSEVGSAICGYLER